MILLHNHTAIGSNTRGFLDSINRVEEMVDYAIELGHSGLCISDHDCTASHIDLLHYVKNLKAENFKPICGNEIYLCNQSDIDNKDYKKLFHFLLIAKDEIGHRQIRELSTKAWTDNYYMHAVQRTPTSYTDLFDKLKEDPGHLIGLTACLGSRLDNIILEGGDAKTWALRMEEKFGKGNFFMEMQPSYQEEQIKVNKEILNISKSTGIPYVITTDSHYLKESDRELHKVFLESDSGNSGSREVGDFYNTTYMMSEKEIHQYMDKYLGYESVQLGIDNTEIIGSMCEVYSLDKPLDIPYIPFDKTEPDEKLYNKYVGNVPLLKYFYESEHDCDRHMCREILNRMEERPEEFQNQKTYDALQECFQALIASSEALHTQWSGYLLVCKELIKSVWESDSLCGVGRGSGVGFLLLYMLDITQINPLREDVKTYAFRFLHDQRASVVDIDFDSEGNKKDDIIACLRSKYGGVNRVTKVQTISTAKGKKAIQIACRALGYAPEEAIALGRFIDAERGIQYTLGQTYYGDPENDLKPNAEFVNLMNGKYNDVWQIAQRIEGLCVGVGSHAGGLILSGHDISDNCALMRTKAGDIITQVDLHRAEDMGLIKYDALSVDCLDRIHQCMNLLIEDGLMEWQGDLKSTYDKYLGVYNIDRDSDEIWDAIDNHKVLSLFQFEKKSGYQAIELGKPRSLEAMSALNSVMRLMAQTPGGEVPLQRYKRMRENISEWYKEMDEWGLTKEEQKWLEQYALKNYGLLPNQENFMIIVQDPKIGGYNLVWADKLRKSIAKKNPKAFNELQEEFFENVKTKGLSEKLCDYVWKVLICMSRGYGFNTSHTLAYSIIALQETNLAVKYPSVYWNCANLISDTGGETSTVNYGKNAMSMSRMEREGIKISPPDINKSRFDFRPDIKTNSILFGLKPIKNVGAEDAKLIVENQPYSSMNDFIERTKVGNTTMISLIKSGAFDNLESKPRVEIMKDFVTSISKPIAALKMSNLKDLIENHLVPEKFNKTDLKHLRFKEFVLTKDNLVEMTGKGASTGFYRVAKKYQQHFIDNFSVDMKIDKDYKLTSEDGTTVILVKRGSLDKVVDKHIQNLKEEVFNNPKVLEAYNKIRFDKVWNDKCSGSISKWEFDSTYYYFSSHEMKMISRNDYGVSDFFQLESNPEPRGYIKFKDREIPKYTLTAICGTVVDKDGNHSTITLLTPTGAVEVKFNKADYNFYAKTIVAQDENGAKEVLDESWFEKGTKLLICGVRLDETFTVKKYTDTTFMKHKVIKVIELEEETGKITKQQEERIGDQ